MVRTMLACISEPPLTDYSCCPAHSVHRKFILFILRYFWYDYDLEIKNKNMLVEDRVNLFIIAVTVVAII